MTTDAAPVDRARLRELAEQATAGPWYVEPSVDCRNASRLVRDAANPLCVIPEIVADNLAGDGADAAFIAAARTAVPALLDALAALRAGEADDPGDHLAWPTPSQWLRRFNDATPEQRLQIAQWVLDDGEYADRCFQMDHEERLERAEAQRDALRATVERVEALCDRVPVNTNREPFVYIRYLRAALAGDES